MTPLKKPLSRRSLETYPVAGSRHLIVSLEPRDIITIRPARCTRKAAYSITLSDLYAELVRRKCLAHKRAKSLVKRTKINQ